MLLHSMINFNWILFFLYFHEHKNTKLNNFHSILRKQFFFLGCYKSTPLKMNLVFEIRKRHRFQKRNRKKILIIISTLTTCIPTTSTYVSGITTCKQNFHKMSIIHSWLKSILSTNFLTYTTQRHDNLAWVCLLR